MEPDSLASRFKFESQVRVARSRAIAAIVKSAFYAARTRAEALRVEELAEAGRNLLLRTTVSLMRLAYLRSPSSAYYLPCIRRLESPRGGFRAQDQVKQSVSLSVSAPTPTRSLGYRLSRTAECG